VAADLFGTPVYSLAHRVEVTREAAVGEVVARPSPAVPPVSHHTKVAPVGPKKGL